MKHECAHALRSDSLAIECRVRGLLVAERSTSFGTRITELPSFHLVLVITCIQSKSSTRTGVSLMCVVIVSIEAVSEGECNEMERKR